MLVACLLVCIRLIAAIVCATCFTELETPTVRSFHLHGGGDRESCHHGQAQASLWIVWACSVNQDDSAYILPEIPRLPVAVSLFVPLVLFLVSYEDRALIAAHGRGPPLGTGLL